MKLTRVKKSKSLTHGLADNIRQEVLSGKYKPGDRLPSSKYIEEKAGVSRTVVREALAELRAEGLLSSRQGSGVFVAEASLIQAGFKIDIKDFEDIRNAIHILELRLGIEVEMSGKAAINRSEQQLQAIENSFHAMSHKFAKGQDAIEEDFAFHKAIADASNNPYFRRFIDFIGNGVIPAREIVIKHEKGINRQDLMATVKSEHKKILLAIKLQDPDLAKTAAMEHLSNSIHRHRKIEQALTD